ncbi:MAG TPA: hypothetical protein VF800_19965 [Telluria sp.]|jgi:hypothetical protein
MFIRDQFPVSRSELRGLARLEDVSLSLATKADPDIARAIADIGSVIFDDATRLNMDEDIVFLCEFSIRVGMDVLTEEVRLKSYHADCWTVGPRDERPLIFKEGGKNSCASPIMPAAITQAAMA